MSVKDIYQAVVDRKKDDIANLVQAEIDDGTDISSILRDGLIASMDYIGDQFAEGKMFFPEMLLAAQTMKTGMKVLKPSLVDTGVSSVGTVIAGTVKGDLHDIGKNLVAMMLEGGGFSVVDLGFDVEPMAFVNAAKEINADIIAMSALLTTTMPKMGETIKILKEEGIRDQVKVIIGGAPVTSKFADEIGADGYGSDGPAAVELARKLTA